MVGNSLYMVRETGIRTYRDLLPRYCSKKRVASRMVCISDE